MGLPILAAHDGVIRVAERDSGYGWTVVIERVPNGDATRYAHLGTLAPGLSPGKPVLAGERLGTLGHSGAAGTKDNAHLHFVRYSSRAAGSGMRIGSLAGLNLCSGCVIPSLTEPPRPGRTPFLASLAELEPADRVSVVAGHSATFQFSVRFNQPFRAENFVLRPVTDDTITFTNLVDVEASGPTASDRAIFNVTVTTGDNTGAQTYLLRWHVVDKRTNRIGNAQIQVRLDVEAPPHKTNPCPPAATTVLRMPDSQTFDATVDAMFPIDPSDGSFYAGRGADIPFGFNIRFNRPFQPSLVLRPDTTDTITRFVTHFGTPNEDFPGTAPSNDDHVGYYRAGVQVPECVPDGRYFVRWYVIDARTGEWSGLAPSFVLVVSPRPAGNRRKPPGGTTAQVTVDNRVTNGGTEMREDTPAYLSTVTRSFCKREACALAGTDVGSGAVLTAECTTLGDRATNGQDNSAIDDGNPGLYASTRWYGIRWADGRFGYISEVWIASQHRGGLGLPGC